MVSASPEGFLRRVGDHIETRPIKGTAPGGADGAAALRGSAKDHAENVMIVDLARNDLGRVCAPGSVGARAVRGRGAPRSAPPRVHRAGTLRADVGTGALLAATFPPASVTGAPKPGCWGRRGARTRAPRHVLRRVRLDRHRARQADLAVAIRTFTVHGEGDDGCTRLGVGAGIVADSRPAAEWDETCLKAAAAARRSGHGTPALVGA